MNSPHESNFTKLCKKSKGEGKNYQKCKSSGCNKILYSLTDVNSSETKIATFKKLLHTKIATSKNLFLWILIISKTL